MIRKTLKRGLVLAILSLILIQSVKATETPTAPQDGTLIDSSNEGPFELRGFGRVSAKGWLWQIPSGQVSLVRFACQDHDSAVILASKYLADLLSYGAVSLIKPATEPNITTLQVRHGGIWALGIQDQQVYVAVAPDKEKLSAALKNWHADQWQAVPEQAYPRYLDNFDNAGLGIWWMPSTKNQEQLTWMKKHPAVANLHQQCLDMTPAPGVYDLSGPANAITQFKEMGKPYRHMLWTGSGLRSWLKWLQLPGRNFEECPEGFTGRRLFEAGGYKVTQVASPTVHALLKNSLVQMIRRQMGDSQLLAWMEPHGEFAMSDPASIPPGAETRFPSYLQLVKKYNLTTLSQAYTGKPDTFKSWAIPYPDTAYFFGRRGQFLDLDSHPWHWKPGTLEEGEKAGWFKPGFDDQSWAEDLRESKHILSQWSKSQVHPLWFRFEQDIPASFLTKTQGRKIYLHVMPYTEKEGRAITIWVNGKEAGKDLFDPRGWQNKHCQADVSKLLKPGKNDFTIFSNGGRIAYRVFLSNQPGESFPFSDVTLNRQYLDWRDYLVWEKFQTLEAYLKAIRSVDPNRPIKVMTPHLFQSEAMELFEKYGAYPQLTGEGGWYRPMHYKGYSSLRRLPGSSEPGGPVKDAKSAQKMFAMIFWESQDCHDYVFDLVRDLWPFKEVVKWFTDNIPLLKTLGKTDFADFKIGVLRDVRQDSRYLTGKIWNWDLSRGPLPALGLTPVLIDGRDFELGNADHIPVIIDCATTIMTPKMANAVKRYVGNGGIFIAQHHTGRHTPEKRDAWILADVFGLKIEPKLMNQGTYHKWPLGKITFTETQNLFPSLRGKKCKGSGVAIDWKNNEYTGAVSIKGKGKSIIPIANWDDGTMAVTEVDYGKGKFILAGTPFFIRFRDETGKWLNDVERQDLLQELLTSLGVKRETGTTDPRIWFERRESKNGLYDVYFCCAMGLRGNDWKLSDSIPSELTVRRKSEAAAIDATATGDPDIKTTFKNGALSLGKQLFHPYQTREFAIVKEDAGLNGPLHWLEVQRRHWRALQPVSPALADQIIDEAAKIPVRLKEDGLNISADWQVRIDPENPKNTDWVKGTTGKGWQKGAMGSWLSQGWKDAKLVQYRKTITIPSSWLKDGSCIYLGLIGYWPFGIHEKGKLWIDGKLVDNDLRGHFIKNITPMAKKGTMELAFEVDAGKHREKGIVGTLYLRKMPAPTASIDLNGEWTQLLNWQKAGGSVSVPLKKKVFGIRRTVRIPKEWAGKPIRLVVTHEKNASLHSKVGAVIINSTGYMRDDSFEPIGPRLDRWLKPGQENTIELLGRFHMGEKYDGFNADIKSIKLEVYP